MNHIDGCEVMIDLKKNEIEINGNLIEVDCDINALKCNESKDGRYVLIKIDGVEYFLCKDLINTKVIEKQNSMKIIDELK